VADPRDESSCRVLLEAPMPDALLLALRTRFDGISTTQGGSCVMATGVDQAAVRALLTFLWDAGLEVRAMSCASP
jgi:hypothetical protein